MATTTLHSPISLGTGSFKADTRAKPARAPLWRRLYDAFVESRMRQTEREIARYLGTTGGRLTDDVERTIERRFLNR